MFNVIREWYHRFFADPDAVVLFLFLVFLLGSFYLLGPILTPVFVSIVLAYLLMGLVNQLIKWKIPRVLAVLLVYFAFLSVLVIAVIGIFPPLWNQAASFFQDLPSMLNRGRTALLHLPDRFPDYITLGQINYLNDNLSSVFGSVGQRILSFSIATIPSMISLILYLVLVPFLVYFFLMDKNQILSWINKYLPRNRRLISLVWREVNVQFGNYVRGRILEILLVSVVSYITFLLFGLSYSMLLAFAVGISVIVPYIGAFVVTIPVALLALLQFGWGPQFIYIMIAYGLITVLSGYVLEPLLFSEALNLHPVAIIVALLFFGGLWGFWGIFFSIPLATVVQAILRAWPRGEQ